MKILSEWKDEKLISFAAICILVLIILNLIITVMTQRDSIHVETEQKKLLENKLVVTPADVLKQLEVTPKMVMEKLEDIEIQLDALKDN